MPHLHGKVFTTNHQQRNIHRFRSRQDADGYAKTLEKTVYKSGQVCPGASRLQSLGKVDFQP